MSCRRTISVAIPIYNEESGLNELFRRVTAVLTELVGWEYEVIFVDDGSSDGSLEWLEAMAAADPRVKVLALSRNFGHQAALTAALDHVSGEVVVMMDGDLQDEPEVIPRFLAEYAKGHEVVYAIRHDRKESWWLRTCYDGFYRIISALADIHLPQGAGDFALVSRRVVEQMRRSGERHRYLRGLRTWVGFRQCGIDVERAARHAGKSKYSAKKLLQLAFDGIFSFSVVPLRAATVLGCVTIASSLAFASYALFAKLVLGQQTVGFTALILAITFLAGVQLLFLGVIGEYVGRIYQEVKQRPHYIVDRLIHAGSIQTDQGSAFDLAPSISSAAQEAACHG
jgi:dolichol-phosphate mannosyltransferase